MQVAVICFLAPFWTIPTLLLSGTSAAVGIALVNAIGNVGGFVGPMLIGFLRSGTNGDRGAFLTLGAMSLAGAAVCAAMTRSPGLQRRPAAESR